MNIVFIIMMVIGALAVAASFLLPSEDEVKSEPLSFGKEEKKTSEENLYGANAAIEAAKKKAKENIDEGYKFDLHLTDSSDSSDRTVEELERDLLGDLGLADDGADVVSPSPTEKPATSGSASAKKNGNNNRNSNNKNNKNNNKGGSGKKTNSVNERYDDLLFEETVDNKSINASKSASNNNSGNKSGNSGNRKKGKKK